MAKQCPGTGPIPGDPSRIPRPYLGRTPETTVLVEKQAGPQLRSSRQCLSLYYLEPLTACAERCVLTQYTNLLQPSGELAGNNPHFYS